MAETTQVDDQKVQRSLLATKTRFVDGPRAATNHNPPPRTTMRVAPLGVLGAEQRGSRLGRKPYEHDKDWQRDGPDP